MPQAWAGERPGQESAMNRGIRSFLKYTGFGVRIQRGSLTCLGMDVGPESIERMQEIHLLAGGLGTNRSSLCASGANITILPLLMAG